MCYKCFLVLLCCQIGICNSENKDFKKEENGEGLAGSLLSILANPKLQTAVEAGKELKKLLSTDSSSHIQSREKTPGFEFLDVFANVQQTKGLPKHLLNKLVKQELQPFSKDLGQTGIKDIVEKIDEYIASDVEQHGEQFFGIMNDAGHGYAQALFFYYTKRDDGRYNIKKLRFKGEFRLAADLVITRESKRSSFKSSSKDVIKYLPRKGITKTDIDSLLDIIVPKLASLMAGFLPDESDVKTEL